MLTYDLERRGRVVAVRLFVPLRQGGYSFRDTEAGEKLPSKRGAGPAPSGVGGHCGERLQSVRGGGVYRTPRRSAGYFVGDVETAPAGASRPGDAGAGELGRRAPRLLDLKRGGAARRASPSPPWARLMRRVLTERGRNLLRAVPHSGVPELRRPSPGICTSSGGISAGPGADCSGGGGGVPVQSGCPAAGPGS